MATMQGGGLSGKARLMSHRRRAERIAVREMLDEYFDPQPATRRPVSHIPIRSRAEFVPTAGETTQHSPHESSRQLELPLAVRHVFSAEPSQRPAAANVSHEPWTAPAVVPTDRRAGGNRLVPRRDTKPVRRPFSIGGFVIGCLAGTAVAAVLLLIVRAVAL